MNKLTWKDWHESEGFEEMRLGTNDMVNVSVCNKAFHANDKYIKKLNGRVANLESLLKLSEDDMDVFIEENEKLEAEKAALMRAMVRSDETKDKTISKLREALEEINRITNISHNEMTAFTSGEIAQKALKETEEK